MEASLALVKTDLADLLASNNVFTGTLTINSASTLTAAESLGNKISIVSGSVVVTQNSTAIDAAKLQAVVSKIKTITGDLNYTHSGTGVTAVNFDGLTGVNNITLDQEAAISLPELSSAAAVTFTTDAKVTGVSAPKLQTVTSFNGAAINFSNATEVNLASLKRYDTNFSITSKSGNVNLSAFENKNVSGTATSYSLTISGAETLTAPLLTAGAVVANDLTSVDLPMWKYAAGSSFTDAETITLPSVENNASLALTTIAPKAKTVNITATKKQVSTTVTNYPAVSALTHTALESLTLTGDFGDVNINGAAKLTALSLTGNANDVTVSGTDIEAMVLAHTAEARGTDIPSLVIENNADLVSVTADSVDDIATFTLKTNAKLETISFAALNSIGAATSAAVAISGNKLIIDNVQLPSASGAVPVVAKKIVSEDFAGLKAYLTAAKAKAGSVKVTADDVAKSTDAAGTETADPTDADLAIVINYDAAVVSDAVGGVAKKDEFSITAMTGNGTFTVNGLASTITNTGSDLFYDLQTWSNNTTNQAQFASAGVTVTVGKGAYEGEILLTDANPATSTYKLVVNGKTFTATLNAGSSEDAVLEALRALVVAGTDVATSALYSVSTAASKIKFVTGSKGSASSAFTYSLAAYEDAALTTAVTITKTANAMAQPTTSGYIRVVSNEAGVAGARTAAITGASVTVAALTASGTSASGAGDDENVVAAANGTGQTNATAVAAARVDNTSYLSAS